jgi:hypothetical protein
MNSTSDTSKPTPVTIIRVRGGYNQIALSVPLIPLDGSWDLILLMDLRIAGSVGGMEFLKLLERHPAHHITKSENYLAVWREYLEPEKNESKEPSDSPEGLCPSKRPIGTICDPGA